MSASGPPPYGASSTERRDAGVGKSTLLEAARSRARDVTCLVARGVESESQLGHAGLLELLQPVRAAHHALTVAFCALCRGDLDEVVAVLEERLAVDGGVGAAGEPLGVAPLLVDAYAGLGRVQEAHALTAEDDAAATAAFALALEAHGVADDPFEAARTRLLQGARLRRAGQRVAAREHLAAARDAFESMDVTHWSLVARDELAATGATARRGAAPGEAPLTSHETRVALRAAQGMSNREIAAALFLSPKTVERHLSSVFHKRGFRSRAQLAAAFATSAEGR